MPVYFVDSSALVKRYRHEAGSERVTELLDVADRLVIARLAQVEVSAAIVRRARQSGITTAEWTVILETWIATYASHSMSLNLIRRLSSGRFR